MIQYHCVINLFVGQIQIDVGAKSQANVETGLELGDPQRPHGGSKGGLRAAALCGGLSEVCARTEAACRVSEAAHDSLGCGGERPESMSLSKHSEGVSTSMCHF